MSQRQKMQAIPTVSRNEKFSTKPRCAPSPTNADLVGLKDGRQLLDTPCLLIDLPLMSRNIALAARKASMAGKELWPHVKTHKCVEVARRQLAAGATGLSVASVGEAEVFAAHGLGPILVTSTLATDRQIERVAALLKSGSNITLVADNPDFVMRLERCLESENLICDVVVDIDMGRQRAGCSDEAAAVALAMLIEQSGTLLLRGVQAYAGHLSHMRKFSERRQSAQHAANRSRRFLNAISDAVGRSIVFCAGGSTGASQFDLTDDTLSALQWGSYVFMDVEYNNIEIIEPEEPNQTDQSFGASLLVASRVISAIHDGRYTMDAGDKRFANKYGFLPVVASGASDAAEFEPQSDEHGLLRDRNSGLTVGDKVELVVPHSDPTVNLHDYFHVVDGRRLVDIWTVDARGVY